MSYENSKNRTQQVASRLVASVVIGGAILVAANTMAREAEQDRLQRQCEMYARVAAVTGSYTGVYGNDGRAAARAFNLEGTSNPYCRVP